MYCLSLKYNKMFNINLNVAFVFHFTFLSFPPLCHVFSSLSFGPAVCFVCLFVLSVHTFWHWIDVAHVYNAIPEIGRFNSIN